MLPDDTRSKIKNITAGIVIEGGQDNCTAIRNLLCTSFETSTTVKKDFEGKAIIKERQASLIESYCNKKNLWVAGLPFEERYLTRGGEARLLRSPYRRIALNHFYDPNEVRKKIAAVWSKGVDQYGAAKAV